MANIVPSDTHAISDTGHTADHNNITDVLGLLTAILASGAGPSASNAAPPGGNAANVAALVAALGWTGSGFGAGFWPWEFPVTAYGAKGDGKCVTDGAMSSSTSTTTLTCATSTPFTAGDVGKPILVVGAATAASPAITTLSTTIASFTNSSTVVLTAACQTTVSSAIVMPRQV